MRKPERSPSLRLQGLGPGPTGTIGSALCRWALRSLIILGLAVSPGCSATRLAMGPTNANVLPGIKTTTSIGDRPVTVVAGVTGDSQGRRLELADQDDRVSGRISGQVLNERGEPVPEAEIRLADGSRPFGRDFRARTDASGRFILRDLNPGSRYTLVANIGRGRTGRFGRAVAEAPDGDVLIRIGSSDGLPAEDQQTAMESDRGRARIDRVSDRREVPVFDSDPPPLRINLDDLPAEGFQEIVSRDSEWESPAPVSNAQRSGWRSAGPIGLVPINADGEVEGGPAEFLDEADVVGVPVEVAQGLSAFGLPIEEEDLPNPLPPAIDGPDPSIPPNDFPETVVGSAEPVESSEPSRPTNAPGDLDFPATSPEFPEATFEPSPDSRSLPAIASAQSDDTTEFSPGPEPESEPVPSIPPTASEADDSPPELEGFPAPLSPDEANPAPDSESEAFRDDLADEAIQEAFPEPSSDFPEPAAVEEPPATSPPDLSDFPTAVEPLADETPPTSAPEPEQAPSEEPEPESEIESSSASSSFEPEATDEPTLQEAETDPEAIDNDNAMPADVFLRVDTAESPEVEDLSAVDESSASDEGDELKPDLQPSAADSQDLSTEEEPESADSSSIDEEAEMFVAGSIAEPTGDEPEALTDDVPPLEDATEPEDSDDPSEGPVGSSKPATQAGLAAGKPSTAPGAETEADADRPQRPTWRDLTLQSSVRRAQVYPPSVRRSGEPRAQNVAFADEDRKGRFGLSWLNGQRDQQVRLAACEFDERKNRLVDFTLPDLQGRPVHFQDLDADYLLLDFWGTWCGPCVQSIPRLVELQNRYDPSRLRVIGVAYEQTEPAEGIKRVEKSIRELGINYPILLGEHDQQPCPLASALKIQAYPTLILVDRHGRILWRDTGGSAQTLDRLDRVIAANIRDRAGVIRR